MSIRYFKKIYKDYLNGKLEKRISKGSCTPEWLKNNFKGKYDITYVSANPFINSLGFSLKKLRKKLHDASYLWKATDHFSKIVDVWDFGWDEKLCIIDPKKVNEAYLSNRDNKRKIIHYIQPHVPYISCNYFSFKKSQFVLIRNKVKGRMSKIDISRGSFSFFRKIINFTISKLREEYVWRMRENLGVEPNSFF